MPAQVHGISNSIFCSRCSMKGHRNQSCTNQIRCRSCYNYGHIAAKCLSRLRSKRYSSRIKSYTSIYAGEKSISTSSPLSQSDRSISHVSESPLNPSPAREPSPMANYDCDPFPQSLLVWRLCRQALFAPNVDMSSSEATSLPSATTGRLQPWHLQ
jgi:hypothetical protein